MRVWFTDFWHEETEEAICGNRLYQILAHRFDLTLDANNPDWVIHSCFGHRHLCYPKTPKLCFLGENIRPNFHLSDRIIGSDHIEHSHYLRMPLYRLYPHYDQLLISKDVNAILQEKKRFCSFVVSNGKAKERVDFFHRLSHYKQVDSGGRHLNNVGGPVPDKLAFLKPYKFSIAFENSSYPGYATEKLSEAMVSGTIPIYWGDPCITQDFNPESFINVHDYASFDEAIEDIITLDQDHARYRRMLEAPYFRKSQEPSTLTEDFLMTHIGAWLNNPPKHSITEQNGKIHRQWRYFLKMICHPKRNHYLIEHLCSKTHA